MGKEFDIIVPIQVSLKSLSLKKSFIYMLDQSVDYNIKAFFASMRMEPDSGKFTFMVGDYDLAKSQNVPSWVKP